MKNRVFSILLSIFLFLGIGLTSGCAFANPEDAADIKDNTEIQNIIYDEETKRQLIGEMNESVTTKPRMHSIDETVAKSPYQKTNTDFNVVPKLHSEIFDVMFMFVKVMLGVAIASVIIYGLLLLVKKYFGENLEENVPKWDNEVDLRTPKNDTSALRGFLNQTKNRQD